MRTRGDDTLDDPQRRCILSRESSPRDGLVRLALASDGRVLPDVRARAPGRGAWIGVSRAELDAAMGKRGQLRGALARAFKTGDLIVPDDLPEQIERGLERAALDRLGLEARSGFLLSGSDKVEAAARAAQVRALYHAADASDDGRRKLAQAWRVGSDREGERLEGLVLPVPRLILSLALGRENVVHIALTDRAAAERVGAIVARWLHFIGAPTLSAPCETASQGASAAEFSGPETAVDVRGI